MKVSTDACIQGAWAAQWLSARSALPRRKVLDIGTGTGLLSLMIVQVNRGITIDAIELNQEACAQAAENFHASPWREKLTAFHKDLNTFAATVPRNTYDFIICNPPFFHNHLQAQQKERNDARHSISLSKHELAPAVSLLLQEHGVFCVLYPQSEWADWLKAGREAGLYPFFCLEVRPKATAETNRIVGLFAKKNNQVPETETLVIYEEDKKYTEAFIRLLRSYYLAL